MISNTEGDKNKKKKKVGSRGDENARKSAMK